MSVDSTTLDLQSYCVAALAGRPDIAGFIAVRKGYSRCMTDFVVQAFSEKLLTTRQRQRTNCGFCYLCSCTCPC